MTVLLIATIAFTGVWAWIDSRGLYDPHEPPAVFLRWFTFTLYAFMVCWLFTEPTNERWILFIKLYAIRGATFNPWYNLIMRKPMLYAKGTWYDKWWYPFIWIGIYLTLAYI